MKTICYLLSPEGECLHFLPTNTQVNGHYMILNVNEIMFVFFSEKGQITRLSFIKVIESK